MTLLRDHSDDDVMVYCTEDHIKLRPDWRNKGFSKDCAISDCDATVCGQTTQLCQAEPKNRRMDSENGNIFFSDTSKGCADPNTNAYRYATPDKIDDSHIVLCDGLFSTNRQDRKPSLSIRQYKSSVQPNDTPLDSFSVLWVHDLPPLFRSYAHGSSTNTATP